MIRFEVLGRINTLNWYRNAHFRALHKDKKDWEQRIAISVKSALKKAKLDKLPTPLTLSATIFTKRTRDVDGGILAHKYALDAFVAMGVIPDDTPTYVKMVILGWRQATDQEKVVYIIQ